MITKQNLLLSLLLLFVLTNCQNKNITTEQSKQCEPIVLKSHKSSALNDKYANLVNVIKLETNDSSLLSTITRIYMDENLFFIFDSYLSKLIIFNNEGKYINQIGKKGEGPKEYGALLDFCVSPQEKQIYLLCDHPNKMMVFDYQGNFIREKCFDILYRQIMVDNKLFT